MKRERAFVVVCVWASVVCLCPVAASAQTRLGQYQDEAPIRTWNSFPFTTAAGLARGGGLYTLSLDSALASANPALLTDLENFRIQVNSSFQAVEFFKYGPVNTGLFRSEGNIGLGLLELDYAGLGFRLGGWAFALNVSQTERFNRPEASYTESSGADYKYLLRFTQTGYLRTFQLSAARRIAPWLSAGISVNAVSGQLDRETLERETPAGFTLLDTQSQKLSGFGVQAGLLFELIPNVVKAAAVVKAPYFIRAENTSLIRYTYTAPYNTDIGLTASSKDSSRQPLTLGFGLSWRIFTLWTVAVDATYFAWSKYTLDYFGERQARDFRDVVRLAAGAEYATTSRIFGDNLQIPFRIGFIYDPQPTADPRSAYACFTFGNGIHGRRVRFDMGALLGRESGSGNKLAVKRFAISLSFDL
jgi:hypothetical protein